VPKLGIAALIAMVAVTVAGGALWLSGDETSSAAGNRYTAYVGNGARGIAVSQFMPSALVINEDDSINWTNPYAEPHTVSFNAGKPAPTDTMAPLGDKSPKFDGTQQFSSGFLRRGDSIEVTFTKAGVYQLLCLIHAGQIVDVTVISPGMYVPSQSQIDAQAKQQFEAALVIGDRLYSSIQPPERYSVVARRSPFSEGPSEHTTWTLPDAPSQNVKDGSVTINAFVPQRLSVGVGDTVTWLDTIAVPHTITFLAGGPPRSPTAVVRPGGGLYDGTSYVNSGQLGNAPGRSGTSFSLTFTQAGTYPYICILHVDQGMAGVIEVGGATTTVRPPSTGDAGLLEP
jgi:plastocyanin